MRIKITVVCSAIIALFPCASFADFDPTTFIQDQLTTHQEQINTIIKNYTGKELDMQQLTNSPNKLKNLKKAGLKLAIGSAVKYAPQMIIRSKVLKGISGKVKGSFATPELANAVNNEMSRNNQVNNDAQKARERREKLNKLQVQNVSILYAKALVTRRSIINETEQLDEEEKQLKELIEECSGSTNGGSESDSGRCEGLIPILTKSYTQTVDRANARWRSILDFTANYYGQKASIEYLGVSISRADKDEQAAEEAAKKEQASSLNLANGLQNGSGADLLIDPNKGKEMFNKGKDIYGKVKNGDYGGALGEAGDIAGDYGLDKAGDYIGKAGSTYDKGKRTINDVKSGDYGGALGEASGIAGDYGLDKAGDYIGKTGSAYNAGKNAANNVQSGNYGAAIGNLASGATSVGGSYMDDKTKNIMSGVQKGANSSDSIIYNVGKGDWKAAAKGAENAYKDVKNTVKTEDKNKDNEKTEGSADTDTDTGSDTKDGSDFEYPLTHENQPKPANKESDTSQEETDDSQVTPPFAPKGDEKNTKSSPNWNFSLWGNNSSGASSKTPTWPNSGNN